MQSHSLIRHPRRRLLSAFQPVASPVVLSIQRRSASDEAVRGGDVFEMCVRPDGSAAMLLADLSSKGQRSLAHMEMLRTTFRRAACIERSPARLMSMLNTLRFDGSRATLSITFASAFIVNTERTACEVRYASAGHDIALFVSGRHHRHCSATGPILGIFDDATYTECVESFADDDLFVLATDGVTECRSPIELGRQFGTTGIVKALAQGNPDSCMAAASAIVRSADAYTNGRYRDDATVVVAKKSPRKERPEGY
jgi:sigma-B regulation protein RsbU (phosphoserine phosphatase)